MSSKYVKPQSSSPPSQPENVKTVGHEFKQQNTAVRHEDGNVSAGPWTKVLSDRPDRLSRRLKVLAAHRAEKKSSSPPLGQKGPLPSSRPAELSKNSFINARIAKERKSQQEFSALQAQVATLTGTLDSLMQMLKLGGYSGFYPKS